jgi:hypothetical protein
MAVAGKQVDALSKRVLNFLLLGNLRQFRGWSNPGRT